MKRSVGFIGGGRSTRIILNAMSNRDLKFKRVVVSDVNPLVIERLKNRYPFIDAESASVAAGQGFVFLAMEKELFMDTLGLINSDFRENSIIISLSPDINFAKLALRLQNFHKIARILPDPPLFVNQAYIPISFSTGFTDAEKDDVLKLFGHFGRAIEVPEDKLQTYSTMSSVLPAYFWYQWEELMKMGQELGLTQDETIEYINESIRSSLYLRYKSGLTEDQVAELMPLNPAEENEAEIKEYHRQRLIELYRRQKPVIAESGHSRRVR